MTLDCLYFPGTALNDLFKPNQSRFESTSLEARIEKGDVEAMKQFGYMVYLGLWRHNEYGLDRAKVLFAKAAAAGDAEAIFILSDMYLTGRCFSQDLLKSTQLCREAADLGFAPAQFRIGYMYENGYQEAKDLALAFSWHLKAANQGLRRSQYAIGRMYEEGRGVKRDYGEAYKWYFAAAKQGNRTAMAQVGLMHMHGQGVYQDLVEAYAWLNIFSSIPDYWNLIKEIRAKLSSEEIEKAQKLSDSLRTDFCDPSDHLDHLYRNAEAQ